MSGPRIEGLRIEGLRSRLAGPFDLTLEPGTCVGVTGPSGAGKSLLLRMVADLDPHEGEAWLDGIACSAMPAASWRRRVMYVPAEPGWWDESVAPHFPDRAAAQALAARFALKPGLLEGTVRLLSTGERQRLALVRALLAEPAVLLLDEPTGALDAASSALVEDELRARLAAGMALLLVTHDPPMLGRLGARHYAMAAGRLSAVEGAA